MRHARLTFLCCAIVASGAIACDDGTTAALRARTWIVWSIKTTGIDLDPNGYTVAIDSTQNVSAGIEVTDSVRVSPGAHTVRLKGLSSNCAESSNAGPTVRLDAGQRLALSFRVSCKLRQIAVTAEGRLSVLDRDGQNQVRLSASFPEYVDSWSPDGQTLLYSLDSGGRTDLWLTAPDGSNRRQLTNSPTFNHGGSWSPDGRQIAYHAIHGSGPSQVYIMNADGSNQHAVTNDSWPNIYPKWSPDGTRLVLFAERTDYQVVTMKPDGTDRLYLTPTALRGFDPTWSPDGGQIAFTGTPLIDASSPRELYVMNADGSNIRQLTSTGHFVESPDWSPDGAFIVFSERTVGLPTRLGIYSVADGTLQTLPVTSFQFLYPRWRP